MTYVISTNSTAQPVVLVDTTGAPVNPASSSGGGTAMTQAEFIAALKSGTGTKTSVASGIASVTLLASNASRKGASIANTDANILYIDCSGGAASASSFTTALAAGNVLPTYFEVPFGYTGAITGIWSADGAGAAVVTEYT